MAGTASITPVAATPAPTTAAASAASRFKAISSAEYVWRQTMQAPDEDSPKGTPLHLPDVGPKAQAEKLARWTDVSRQLDSLPQAALSAEDRINFTVYEGQIDALLAAQRYRDYEKPFNADSSFWGDVAEWARGDFKAEQDYRSYIEMLREIPRYYDEQIANMRAGLARGFTAPQITLVGRDTGVAQIVGVKTPEESPFYAPFETLPATIPVAVQTELRQQAAQAIRESVVPAHAKLLHFLRDDYFPRARTSIDAYALPGGQAYYRSKIREFVTEDKSPEDIHQLGLAEVARIRAQMLDVMKRVDFKGDLPAFLTFLRTDPRFYAKTPQELLDRAAWIAKTFDGKAKD